MGKNILIFYISRFSGHYHAARSISKAINIKAPDARVRKINTFEYTNPILGRLINRAYMEVIKKKPEIWGNMYDNPEVLQRIKKARSALHKVNSIKMKKLLDGFSPDSVVCTQAFPCGLIADFKRNTGSNIELTGVLTDHAPHSYWLFDEVDNYVVPSGETADELVRKGVDPLRVHEMGVPIDPKFAFKHDKTLLLKAIGFDESSPVILLMGGNQGLGAMEEVLKTLIIKGQDRRYQLIIVTGANKRLYFRLQKMVSSAECDNVLILPYVDNIDELMEISDLIVTKAGGITTAESLAKGLPMILVNPIPGQERMNADYLEKKGLAIEIKDIERIPGKLKDLLEERDELTEMKKRIEEEAKPLSAIHIAELVLGTSAG